MHSTPLKLKTAIAAKPSTLLLFLVILYILQTNLLAIGNQKDGVWEMVK
jgi:hypothetical protein